MSYTHDDLPAGHDTGGSGADHGPARATRHDGWTVARQFDFLADLGENGSVTRAAAAVGMSPSSIYRLLGREPDGAFAAGFHAATAMAYARLRDLAFERIENGTVQTHFYKGQLAGTKLVFSDRLLLGMLNHLRPAPADARTAGGRTAGASPAAAPGDPADAYAAAIDAYAVALETGAEPVAPAVAAPAAPAAVVAPAAADILDAPDAEPSPGEGPYHDARVAAAQARLRGGLDPHPRRFPGRVYAPKPDADWLACYPDGLSAEELAAEDAFWLTRVGLAPTVETPSPAVRS